MRVGTPTTLLFVIAMALLWGCSGGRSRGGSGASGSTATVTVAPIADPSEPTAADPTTPEPSTADPSTADPSTAEPSGPTPSPSGTPTPAGTGWFAHPRTSASIFASGHSLLDGIFDPPRADGGPIAALARSAGKTHRSVYQDGLGSTTRLRHEDITAGRYPTPTWSSFDTLIITERADPHSTVIWEHTIEEMSWFAQQVRGAPPGDDEVFIYQTWLGFAQGGQGVLTTWPAWAEYHRIELSLYECIAAGVTHRTGAPARVIPATLALSELISALEAGEVPGTRGAAMLESDQVHASALGKSFLTLVVFASVYRTPTTGLTMRGVPPALLALMQRTADRVVSEYYARRLSPSVQSCRQTLAQLCLRRGGGCDHYLPTGFPDGSI